MFVESTIIKRTNVCVYIFKIFENQSIFEHFRMFEIQNEIVNNFPKCKFVFDHNFVIEKFNMIKFVVNINQRLLIIRFASINDIISILFFDIKINNIFIKNF